MGDAKRKHCGCAWRLLGAAVVCLLLLAAALLAFPLYVEHLPLPDIVFDASPYLGEDAARLFDNKSLRATFDVRRCRAGGLRVVADGRILDWNFTSSANVRFGFLRVHGDFSARLLNTDLKVDGDFDVKSAKNWRFSAYMPETRFSSDDKVLGRIIPRLGLSSVSNITCTGICSFDASGKCTDEVPVPEWKVKGSLKNVDASLVADEVPISVGNFRVRFGADGIADRCEIAPMFPRVGLLDVSGIAFTNVFASVRSTEKGYLITEAGSGCMGGELKMYSLFLDPESLSAGATIYVEDVDTAEVMSLFFGFQGEATGRLYGKMNFSLRNGETLRLRDVFLFSNPGETGTLRIGNGKPLVDNLAIGGVPDDVCQNLAKALANLDYSVLRLKLKKGAASDDTALTFKLNGSATHEKTTVPVNLDITLRGDINQIINTGMRIKRRSER